eukprot:1416147-Prymnesium_polylepis.1
MISIAERVNGTARAQHQAVYASHRHSVRSDAAQPLDDPRRVLVLLIAVAQRTKLAKAERIDDAVLAQRQRVVPAHRDAAHAHRRQPRHHCRHRHIHLLSVAHTNRIAILVRAQAARQQPPLHAHKRVMVPARADRRPLRQPLPPLAPQKRLRH